MDKQEIKFIKINYIHTPAKISSPTKIDAILEKRMREFMLTRRRLRWIEIGE